MKPSLKPRKIGQRVFDSMSSAAAALSVGLDVLKRAKSAGCPAFRASRIHEKDLLAWLTSQAAAIAPADLEALEIERLKQQCRKAKRENDKQEKLLIERALVDGAIEKTLAAVRSLLERKLENEYPPLVAGLGGDVTAIRIKSRELADTILIEMAAMGSIWDI